MTATASSFVKIIAYQILITLTVSVIFSLMFDIAYGKFAFLGGLIGIIPNAYLGIRLIRSLKLEAKKFINSFYASESIKLLITATLFFLVFKMPDIKLLPLLACYVSTLSVFWFALLMR
ncbi:MAG: synthase protein [Pseudomonadota bacterium]|nr:synthase protein [Pseudomonadota bacterium]